MEACWSLNGVEERAATASDSSSLLPSYYGPYTSASMWQAQSPQKEVVLHTASGCGNSLPQEGAGAGSFCGLKGS